MILFFCFLYIRVSLIFLSSLFFITVYSVVYFASLFLFHDFVF
jgi:hypothetical protein